ncbi:MAG: hypothetical protein V3T05_12100 [Myxococcota bacterium]
MKIEDDDRLVSNKRRNTMIRQIQQYQEQADNADASKGGIDPKKLDQISSTQLVAELEKLAQTQGDEQTQAIQADDAKAMETRSDVQSVVRAREVARIEQTHGQVTAADRTTEAVDTANRQQDAGQNWERFSQASEATALPPSVADAKREAEQKEADRDEQQRISARDFQNDMAIRRGMIKS